MLIAYATLESTLNADKLMTKSGWGQEENTAK